MSTARGRICVCIGVADPLEAAALVKQEAAAADVIEIRLDMLRDHDPSAFLNTVQIPLLFTNRPEWEGGHFQGSERERIDLLAQAAAGGAAYVDCELRAPEASRMRLQQAARETGTRCILSWHDFSTTPSTPELAEIVRRMQGEGADIGKVVTTAANHREVLRVLALQDVAAELRFPLIAFCMGLPGMISRLATLLLGGYMTYCAPCRVSGTAAGQLNARQMSEILGHFGQIHKR